MLAMLMFAAGCGVAYQAATERRANKMENQLTPGLTMAQVRQTFGQPDIEDQADETTELWSYAKHANNNDMAAEVFYTTAKAGDTGTFEDLKFVDGKLASWGEGQHTMAEKESSGLTTNFGLGHGGGRHGSHGSSSSDTSSSSSGSSDSSDEAWPTTN